MHGSCAHMTHFKRNMLTLMLTRFVFQSKLDSTHSPTNGHAPLSHRPPPQLHLCFSQEPQTGQRITKYWRQEISLLKTSSKPLSHPTALCLKRLICLKIIAQHRLKNKKSVTHSIHCITQDNLLKNINA